MPTPNIPIDKLRAVSPCMAEALTFWLPGDLNTDVREIAKRRMELIAADLLRLAEEVEALKEKRDAETDSAYKGGKQDGYQLGYDDAQKGL